MLQDTSSALCTLCEKLVRTGASNTSGMVRHLKRYHQEVVVGSNLGNTLFPMLKVKQ